LPVSQKQPPNPYLVMDQQKQPVYQYHPWIVLFIFCFWCLCFVFFCPPINYLHVHIDPICHT
jgi:hypothetical protein